jgi:hypothetical protein
VVQATTCTPANFAAQYTTLQVLCEFIAGMHDADGQVTLPSFYDQVCVLSDEERSELARILYS